MQQEQMRDAGKLVGQTLGEFAVTARGVHRAVAARVFGLLGPVAAPARVLHDAIAATAYCSSELGARALPAAAGAVAASRARPDALGAADTTGGRHVLSAVNGILGDQIAVDAASLAPALRLRTHDGRLRERPSNLAHDARTDRVAVTGKIVVFAHGLCEDDRLFALGAGRAWGDRRATYGSLLRDERGWTPLYAHYNTGLRVSENGRLLSGYLDDLVAGWPVPVTEVALVGHSMGGLVMRSAAHVGAADGAGWVDPLRHVVGLGTPHLGAPLERWVNAGTHTLARLPETAPFAALLNRRSVGIKDLRYGAIAADDWTGWDADERLVDRCRPATKLPGVAYSMISATLSKRPHGRFAHDLLVDHVSAHGTGRPGATRRMDFEVDRLRHVGGRTHFHLLCDREVYGQLRYWLDGS